MTDPKTVEDLIAWFEQEFTTMTGPSRAYVEVPVGPGGAVHRLVYTGYAVHTRYALDAESRMVRVMFDDFRQIAGVGLGEVPLLIWRLPEKIARASEEGLWKVRTRLVIPALQFSEHGWISRTAVSEGRFSVEAA